MYKNDNKKKSGIWEIIPGATLERPIIKSSMVRILLCLWDSKMVKRRIAKGSF